MEYFKVGKLVAVHGLKGELILKHELGKKTSLKGLKTLFVEETRNNFLPWFLESVRIKNDSEVYIKFEGVNTRETAQKLAQRETWMQETDFKTHAAKKAPASLLGYTIINGESNLGEILEVIEQPHQLLCRLEMEGKEVLIPLHEEFLKKIDHRNRKVYVTLPEGLVELYLG